VLFTPSATLVVLKKSYISSVLVYNHLANCSYFYFESVSGYVRFQKRNGPRDFRFWFITEKRIDRSSKTHFILCSKMNNDKMVPKNEKRAVFNCFFRFLNLTPKNGYLVFLSETKNRKTVFSFHKYKRITDYPEIP